MVIRKRKILLIVLALLPPMLILGVLFWRPWHDSEITIRVSLSSDEKGEIVSRRLKHTFNSTANPQPLLEMETDLSDLAGNLAKLDFNGKVVNRKDNENPTRVVVCCAAELVSPDGTQSIDFAGWRNTKPKTHHRGTVGSPAYQVLLEHDSTFFYDEDNSLWHVLRVPAQAKLHLKFTPRLIEELPKPSPTTTASAQRLPPFTSTGSTDSIRPPDIFIYLIDSLRADHLGCYGYSRPTSPHIDAFSKSAALFEQAQTPVTWTRPAVASLFTGLYPSTHGVIHEQTDRLANYPLLLPEALQQSKYRTFSITAIANTSATFGFNQGYDTFVYNNMASPDWVNHKAAEFLKDESTDQPVFMYLHTIEPHSPYAPEPESLALFDRGITGSCQGTSAEFRQLGLIKPNLSNDDLEHLIDLYDAEIYDNDRGFGEFLALLKQMGRFDNAIIILTADHGESFLEHDVLQHGYSLNIQEMRVPLLIRFLEGEFAGLRVKERACLTDIYPTLVEHTQTDLQLDYPLPGKDLTPFIENTAPASSRISHAEVSRFEDNRLTLLAAIDNDGYKRVIDLSSLSRGVATEKSTGLWHTESDPKEQVDLTEKLPVRAAYIEQLIATWLLTQQQWRQPPSVEQEPFAIPEERRRELEALGYLN